VIERLANTVNYFNGGAGVSFPWSWMSIPSVIIMYMLASYIMPSIILPPIEKVVESFVGGVQGSWAQITGGEYDTRNPTLMYNLFTSLREEMVGFGLAVVVSVVLGFIAGFNRGYREYIVPLNGMFMAIPPVAWAPLMMLVLAWRPKGTGFPWPSSPSFFLPRSIR
jgi:NitT/TauT family transport system permease protein/taurine transport system permease protein